MEPKPLVMAGTTSPAGMPAANAVSRLTSTSATKACMRTRMIRKSSSRMAASAMPSRGPAPSTGVHSSSVMRDSFVRRGGG